MMERADSVQKLYTRMRLWEFPDQYVIEPTDGSSGSSLAVSRKDGSMKLIGSYLLVITERESVGSYLGHPIFKISSMKVFPCDSSLNNTTAEQQKKTEMEFSGLLNVAEKTTGLFFSYDANLTLSAQRLNDLGDESRLLPLWRQAEPRFLWNNYMLEVLIDNKLDPYLLPVVQGSFHYFQAAIGKDIIDITLIARRCTRRNGTRMWRRGADPDGYVANFVETEQIMHFNGYISSFVQVRGSIPLPWEQIVDLTYKPKYELLKHDEAPRVLERHFLDLRKKYGAVLAVDLVNGHGGEGRLCEKFGSTVQQVASNDVKYVHFDFHHVCGHVHFDRLSILYDQISDFLERNGYLLLNEKGEKMKEQLGVVRTNCIDCLDRTNVTQSMIARNILEYQLRRIGVFGAEETICSHPNLDERFKILWANHGDDISIQYTGTPALKGDFVRFGHRTIQGILNDGWNALMRYYLNNFSDGTKQDAIDLLQGHYIVSVNRDMAPSSQNRGLEAIASFPLALGLVLTGFLFATMSLRQVRYDFRHLFFSLMWASISVGIAAFVRANGRLFCNRPRLHKPRC
ncbi:phosphoinositide phosphatase SAC6-like isoform X3 [Abrus precatorius]|uniref:Phosphoinositide phosphatase SAC6-like isoform X3 n=1 Tax=Abrus precatorius TaxID=3816 RepID=A0A8B8KRR0_ABRPR|nr:phosphoinositide phosphatase SAC6-like isoform X3 [Abrus precatorius]